MSAAVTYVPLYMKSLGSSYFMSGLPLGVRAVGRFTFDAAAIIIAGRQVPPQTLLALGVTFTGMALLACGLFPSAYPVTAAFFFIGAGVAWVQIALRQIVFEGAESGRRGLALGILSLFLGSGPMVGIFFGGFISEYFGYRSLFAVAALVVLWLPLLLVRLSPPRRKAEGERGSLRPRVVREILSTPGAGLFCASSFFSLFYQPARSLALAFYATESLGLSISSYGVLRGISQLGNINGRFFGGLWTDRSGVVACLASGYFISARGVCAGSLDGRLLVAPGRAHGHWRRRRHGESRRPGGHPVHIPLGHARDRPSLSSARWGTWASSWAPWWSPPVSTPSASSRCSWAWPRPHCSSGSGPCLQSRSRTRASRPTRSLSE